MGLRKCPRCELNYIRDDEKYCNVCKREMKGEPDTEESVLMCIECGENPAVRGSELCAICLREARRQEKLSNLPEDIRSHGELSLTSVALDEIEVPLPAEGEIPENELDEIDKELGEDEDDDLSDDDDDPEDA